MREDVFLAACAVLFARSPTSPATTAKPLPASPARAASIEALSARIFVWNEMSSIVCIIFAISDEVELISSIAPSICVIFSLPAFTMLMESSASA